MQIKTGVDCVEIERVKKAMENENFLTHIFGEKEYEYYKEKGFKAESVAGAWCAKEAFGKLCGLGVRGFTLRDVEIVHDELGKPSYEFHGIAYEVIKEQKIFSMDLSITHDKSVAIAVAVALLED